MKRVSEAASALPAGNLAKGFLSEGGEHGLGQVTGRAAHGADEGVGFLGGAVDSALPAFAGVGAEEVVDLTGGGGGQTVVEELEIDGVVVGAFPVAR